MRFLVDECTGPVVSKWLKAQGHTVFSIFEEARGLSDETIIQKAFDDNWIIVTNDKDFGEKIFANTDLITGSFYYGWKMNGRPIKSRSLKKF